MLGVIAIDGDGVLLDYNEAFGRVWERAFDEKLEVMSTTCYHALNQYGIEFRSAEERAELFRHFDEEAWATMMPMPGAVEAAQALVLAGYRLVCVSSMPSQYEAARLKNLLAIGIPVDRVVATDRSGGGNPKRRIIEELNPVAFVDDLASNFRELPETVYKALINPGHCDSPNGRDHVKLANSVHMDLAAFTQWWLSGGAEAAQQAREALAETIEAAE